MDSPQRRVLIVAQQIALRARIARVLQSAGYAVELAENQKRAIELAGGKQIEAAIVVHSSDFNGLAQELRNRIPRTIVLGHRTDEILRPGHSLRGADAFPGQALDEQKLLDQLRPPTASPGSEGQGTGSTPVILKIEDCQFDLAAHNFVDRNGREVQLTRAEIALLAAFVGSPCRVLSRDQLRRAVVGRCAEPYDRSIDMLVARLRRKIEPNPKAPRFILSVPGVGYKFAIQPQTAENINALPAINLEKFNRSGLREARPVTPPGQGITSRHSEPEKRQVTALSCGLVGLTGAVSLDPEDLVGIVQRFQEICTAIIEKWGGVVFSSVGDEILALFGYPAGHEDDAERAVHAGLDLVANVSKLSPSSGEPLQTQIAIATGLVFIGENQTVIGEAIIIASRLRNITPPNLINVTASTRKLLGSVFVCDDPQLCELEFQGVSKPVTACRVTGRRAIESRFDARRTGTHTRFVGRQHELQQMTALWERAKAGKGQVVLLCGEAGIGKSRICEAWLDRIADEPHVTMRFQCSPHHTNSPFYPIINRLEHVARFEREDTPEIKVKKLESVLSQAGPGTLADTPFFASLLSIPTDGFYSSPNLTPQRQRDLQITALLRQVLGLALTRPVVIKIADAHWMDSSTLELLSRSVGSIKTARVFVICSFRPEFFPPWLDESHVTMLRLDRLSREQTGVIISDVAGGKELPRELHEQIMTKADGVPFFAEELTKTVLESGVLQDTGDRYVAIDPLPSLVIPATLLGSLTGRLDRLGPSKEIAQIGAAIGREFSYRLLAAVAPSSGLSLQTALAHIAASELIFARGEPPNSIYFFKHALVQDAAYATMVRSKRQQLHSRIVDALMEGFPETAETQPELMAYHLAQAGHTEKAIEYLRKAGQRAIEHSASAEAIGHLTRALELLRSIPESAEYKRAALGLEVLLGQAMIAGRGYAAPETKETLLRAKTLVDSLTDPRQKFPILYGIWACHYVGGEVAKQRDAAIELLAEAERHNDTAALCIAHRALGTTYVTTGEFAEGLHHLERARALYDAEQHPCYRFQYGQDIGVAALCYLSWAQWHLGYVDQASEVAAEAMKRAEELSHPHTLVYAICHARGFMDLFRHRCEDTQSYAALVVSVCTENGFSHWLNCGRVLEGWAKVCRGEVDQGIEVLRAGVLGWQQRGARLWLPIFLTLEAEACVEAGRTDAALRVIEEALTISEDTRESWATAEVLRVKARALQAAGRAEAGEIETVLINSLETARRQQARCWELRAACDLARLWHGQGRGTKALKLLESVYEQFTEGFDAPDLRDAKALMEKLKRSVDRKQSERAEKTSNTSKRR
jgi:class 3 adenylate cyclase/DNA-binding response OmpR family regulator/predicted ATPase